MVVRTESIKKALMVTLEIVVLIITIFLAIYAIRGEVRSEVKRITSEKEFLEQLSSKINPYIIFDENNSILVDMGGSVYIDDIIVKKELYWVKEMGQVPAKVTIIPNQLLRTAPILRCIDTGYEYVISEKRGEKFTWEYKLFLSGLPSGPRKNNIFRVDIIP